MNNKINQQKAIMVMSGGEESPLVFGDLSKDDRVIYLKKPLLDISKPLSFIRKIHLATRINKYMQLPFRNLWDYSLALSSIKFDKNTQYHIIFINTSVVKYNIDYLRKIKKKYNISYHLYMLDSISTPKGREVIHYLKNRSLFENIFSFDQKDCSTYDFTQVIQPLSKLDIKTRSIYEYDLYFLGRTKGRLNLLLELSEYLQDIVRVNFKVISQDPNEVGYLKEKGWLSDYVKYSDNINYLNNSNVILEILQENQEGNTLRYQEAILYNKKLLTNNQSISQLPYYNPNYMKVFKDVKDIDLDWLKIRENIDYEYQYDFSARKLIDRIFSTGEKQ